MTELQKAQDVFDKLARSPKKKVEKKTPWIRKCDILFSMKVKVRDGRCLKCGVVKTRLECSHIAPRENKGGCLRWDPKNAITLCHNCHYWWHHSPSEAGPWFINRFPDLHKHVQSKRYSGLQAPNLEELKQLYFKLQKSVFEAILPV